MQDRAYSISLLYNEPPRTIMSRFKEVDATVLVRTIVLATIYPILRKEREKEDLFWHLSELISGRSEEIFASGGDLSDDRAM